MKINVTPPKNYSLFLLRQKTKRYMEGDYNRIKAKNVFEGKRKRYYLIIQKRNIQIELIDYEVETLNDIKRYLEYLFNNQYVGLTFEGMEKVQFKLENVHCFYL